MSEQRTVCTGENPNREAQIHLGATLIDDHYGWPNGDNYNVWERHNCGLRFKETLPDA